MTRMVPHSLPVTIPRGQVYAPISDQQQDIHGPVLELMIPPTKRPGSGDTPLLDMGSPGFEPRLDLFFL